MAVLTKCIAAILLCISTVALHAEAQLGSATIETQLKNVIDGHYAEIGENRLNEAVRFYHSNSPEVAHIRTEIELNQAAFLQRTTTLSFEFTGYGQREDIAFAKARHRFLRIAGMKFFEEFAEVSYTFRKEGDSWKLWVAQMP
jgi:hypothetical protein